MHMIFISEQKTLYLTIYYNYFFVYSIIKRQTRTMSLTSRTINKIYLRYEERAKTKIATVCAK